MEHKLYVPSQIWDSNYNLNIAPFVEQKTGFDYLQWMVAIRLLKKYHPSFEVRVEDALSSSYLYNLENNGGGYIRTYIACLETNLCTDSLFFPVLDYNNNPVSEVNTFDLNTTIQRGKVKCIAYFTGIGARLFSQEDISVGKQRTKKFLLLEAIHPYVVAAIALGHSLEVEPNFGMTVSQIIDANSKLEELVGRQNTKFRSIINGSKD